MEELINSMTNEDPASRPRIEDVLQNFARIRRSLSEGKLRSTMTSKETPKVLAVIQQVRHSVRTVRYMVSRRPAIPDPSASVTSRFSKQKGLCV
jgi:hypothetical protein